MLRGPPPEAPGQAGSPRSSGVALRLPDRGSQDSHPGGDAGDRGGRGPPCTWATLSAPWPGGEGGSLSLSPCPQPGTGSGRRQGHVQQGHSPARPREHTRSPQGSAPHRHRLSATWMKACLPRSPDGGIPGLGDKRRPSNLLPWNSLPGSAPLCGWRELASARRAEGAGAPTATQATPRAQRLGGPRSHGNPDENPSSSQLLPGAAGQWGGRGGAALTASGGDPPPKLFRRGN